MISEVEPGDHKSYAKCSSTSSGVAVGDWGDPKPSEWEAKARERTNVVRPWVGNKGGWGVHLVDNIDECLSIVPTEATNHLDLILTGEDRLN